MSNDPVHQNADGKWYFWNEVWADEHGPFATEEEARQVFADFVAWLKTAHITPLSTGRGSPLIR